jgi:anti-sigma regulatory factor (Ser/Thr protein kinase)
MTTMGAVTRSFPADRRSVTAARRFASAVIDVAPGEVREAVELMVSELATNAVKHVSSGFEVSISCSHGTITVGVSDPSDTHPTLRSPGPDDPTGRGLRIVEMLSDAWGVRSRAPHGKTVWFTVSFLLPASG